jgi:hypothetical protein
VLAGAKVKVCTSRLDSACTHPANESNIAITNDTGDALFDVTGTATGFSGFLLVELDGYLPGYYFFNPPVRADTPVIAVQLASPAAANLISDLVSGHDKTLQPDRGLVLLNAFDCTGKAAAGVTYVTEAADAATIPYYVVGSTPVRTATSTDAIGFGGFINMPATYFPLTGRIEATGQEITKISMFAVAGAISYSHIVHDG